MRLEILEQNSILYTKREFLSLEAKVFMEPLKATSCPCIKIQNFCHIQNTEKVASLKQDCQLYSNLYVACQNRQGDLEKFLVYGNYCSLLIIVNLW